MCFKNLSVPRLWVKEALSLEGLNVIFDKIPYFHYRKCAQTSVTRTLLSGSQRQWVAVHPASSSPENAMHLAGPYVLVVIYIGQIQ